MGNIRRSDVFHFSFSFYKSICSRVGDHREIRTNAKKVRVDGMEGGCTLKKEGDASGSILKLPAAVAESLIYPERQ